MNRSISKCKKCGRMLKPGEKQLCEKHNIHECAECQYHIMNGTDTIEKYNQWLRKG